MSLLLESYLGLEANRNDDGTVILRQPGLINKVIKLCGLEAEFNEDLTPADKILHEFEEGSEPRQHTWSYRQVIGVLNYIAASSRPDITFAVHQCARFSNNPGRIHELAVRHIVRYLKGLLRHPPLTVMGIPILQELQTNQPVSNPGQDT
jgi:hypothetical protein